MRENRGNECPHQFLLVGYKNLYLQSRVRRATGARIFARIYLSARIVLHTELPSGRFALCLMAAISLLLPYTRFGFFHLKGVPITGKTRFAGFRFRRAIKTIYQGFPRPSGTFRVVESSRGPVG